MSQSSQPTNNPNILGTLVSLLGVLAAFLYFTGWIYRWAYYSFFQIEVTTLDLPLESFFIVPFQVFLGSLWAFGNTVLAVMAAVFLIQLTIWLLEPPRWQVVGNSNNLRSRLAGYTQKLHGSSIARRLRSLTDVVPQPLRYEIVIVVWVLIVLFWLARSQGTIDARRDAINDTSVRPVITLVTKEGDLALGRKLDDLLTNPSLKGYRIIGDRGLFDQLRGRESNDTANPTQPIVWRLLIERNGWIYLFKALPSNPASNERPYVLVVRESDGGNQLLILSPEASKQKSE